MQPRIEKPQAGNKYYINKRDGGYNPASGNPNRKNKELTALPNCIAIYSWFNEVGQKGQVYLKKPWYPYAVINAAKKEGLEVTKEPTAGGIMVWTGGKSGEGHVGGCAVVYDKDHILTVESEYYGKDWTAFNRTKGDGNWRGGCYWMDGSYKYQGCIKNPFIEEDMTYEETKALIEKMVPDIIKQMDKAKEQDPADDWAREAIAMCIAKGIMVGYEDGFHPQSNIRREEVAQIVANLTRKE